MLSRTFTVLALLAAANLARAQDRSIGFQMPSKNIACQVFADNGQDMLRCDIMTIDTPPRRPPDCELDYGHAFAMTARGDARGGSARICRRRHRHGPVTSGARLWRDLAARGIHLPLGADRLTCFNAMQHGFSLARGRQEVF